MTLARRAMTGISLSSLLAAAALVASGPVQSATGISSTRPSAEPPVQQLQELAEIRMRGERVSRDVTSAEDAFYELYNELNADDRFDVHCGATSLSPQSLTRVRNCMPGYLTEALGRNGRVQSGGTRNCFTNLFVNGARQFGSINHAAQSASGYTLPCLSLGGMNSQVTNAAHRTHMSSFVLNMATVVSQNDRLQMMVDEITALNDEMYAVRDHYQRRRNEDPSPLRDPRFVHAGPR